MKKIELTQGNFAIVDDEDCERVSRFRWHAQKVCGRDEFYACKKVYNKATKKQSYLPLQRFIMGLKKGDSRVVDHINHNTLDNRKKNLRVCTKSQNGMNQGKRRDNTTGFKGISMSGKKWKAAIKADGKLIYLGTFPTKEQAYEKYIEACEKYHGEFAFIPSLKPVL